MESKYEHLKPLSSGLYCCIRELVPGSYIQLLIPPTSDRIVQEHKMSDTFCPNTREASLSTTFVCYATPWPLRTTQIFMQESGLEVVGSSRSPLRYPHMP